MGIDQQDFVRALITALKDPGVVAQFSNGICGELNPYTARRNNCCAVIIGPPVLGTTIYSRSTHMVNAQFCLSYSLIADL